jgi:phage/plasmid-associated DNA primase
VPWEVSIPEAERDPALPRKLEEELPGILAWLVFGALEWQRVGLAPPAEVNAETEEYRAEQDVLAGFIADKCVEGRSAPSSPTRCTWHTRNGATLTESDRSPKTNSAYDFGSVDTKRSGRSRAWFGSGSGSGGGGPYTRYTPRRGPYTPRIRHR